MKQVDVKQGRQDKLAAVASKFEKMRSRISDLEKTEADLIESVQHSRNWQSRLEMSNIDNITT